MPSPSKRKGDRAELEVQGIFREHLGAGRRALGAGRKDDIGDITGVANLVVQVADWKDVAQAVRHKPLEAECQRGNSGDDHACAFIRLRGGAWRVVMTPEQFFALYRDAIA